MAELTNKLHIKKDGVVHECTCYTTVEEATPTTVPGGSAWEIKNNGVVCYVGLWPTSDSGGDYHTPLKIKKNGVEYYVDTQVVNMVTITITQSANQTIKVTCNGTTHTSTFEALAGSQISVVVEPATGYTAGAPSISSGYATEDLTITASPASKKTFQVTITQSANQTIRVVCNGTEYTSTFTANYGDAWTATVTAVDGYTAGKLSAASGTVTGAVTITATAAIIKKYTVSATQPVHGQIKVNGTKGTSFSINHGAAVTIEAVPDTGYEVTALYVD